MIVNWGRILYRRRFEETGKVRPIGRLTYLTTVAVGVGLAAGQLLILPHFLSAYEFGLVLIGISVTQAGLVFGDLGLQMGVVATGQSRSEKARIRESSYAASWILQGMLVVVTGALCAIGWKQGLVAVVGVGLMTSLVCGAPRLRARASEAAGDERLAAAFNMIWSNAPKLGMIIGGAVGRTALWAMVGGLAGGVLLSVPPPPHFGRQERDVVGSWRLWSPTLLYVGSTFFVTWGDTYVVAGRLGLAVAAGYEVTYRVMGSVSYLYNPFSSVLFARSRARGLTRSLLRSICLPAAAISAASLAALGLALAAFSRQLFPHLAIQRTVVVLLGVLFFVSSLSYVVGNGLLAADKREAVTRANVFSFALALAGHLAFTLHGGPVTAAVVSLTAITVGFVWQAVVLAQNVPAAGMNRGSI